MGLDVAGVEVGDVGAVVGDPLRVELRGTDLDALGLQVGEVVGLLENERCSVLAAESLD